MKFVSSGFCIFLTALTIAHGEKILSKRNADYDAHEEIDCQTAQLGKTQTIRNSMCRVHDRIVDLKPIPGYRFVPSKVSVKRCDGYCKTGFSCEPIETRMTEVYVDLKPLFGRRRMKQCAVVRVEEHVSCRCMCEKTETDCNKRQMFDKKNCKCECKAETENKMKCEEQKEMRWDKDDCSCKCMMMSMQCSTNRTWDEAACKCK
ncbi:balbiani ring protein 3-like isoform X2 [Neodiprion fabricii]|uniref:balbiani ring protein 3-like isoform X2 n=1 Tax=Neodiprion fabricii TaxID=2872261 RepID=UPI001ED901CB|nr:balbiani ring protein 3-like isoform X2 [Neodiprion fabricii]